MQNIDTEIEFTQRIKASRSTVFRLRQAGMPHIRIGRTIRYNVQEAVAWIAENGASIASANQSN